MAAIWGNPIFPTTIKEKVRNLLSEPKIIYLDTMAVSEESVKSFIDQWRAVRPTLVFGHAHSIFLLAQFLEEMNIRDIRPKAIISSSMMLIPHERKKIEAVFGIKVTDRYGCEEVGLISSECEVHHGMHLNLEHLYIEFINEDGIPTTAGQPGKVVVTDLMNRAMPLIRYNLEDMGVPSDRKCPCGRGLPLMESVVGRVSDFLVKKNGTRVAGISLIENTLTKFSGLNQMQIIQERIDAFSLRIVPGPLFNSETKKHLANYFKMVFGETIEITFELIESILPEKSGKFRFSICRVA